MKSKTNPVQTDLATRKKMLLEAKEKSKKNDMLGAAVAIATLHNEFKMSPQDIIKELSKYNCKISVPHIYNHFKLAKVPAKVKTYIRTNKINPTDVLAKIKKHQTENELIREIDKIVAQREIEQEKIIEEKKIQKEKTIQQKIINFLKNQGIIPSEKDRENILKITGKYYAA